MLVGRYWADMSDVTQLLIPAPASRGPALAAPHLPGHCQSRPSTPSLTLGLIHHSHPVSSFQDFTTLFTLFCPLSTSALVTGSW